MIKISCGIIFLAWFLLLLLVLWIALLCTLVEEIVAPTILYHFFLPTYFAIGIIKWIVILKNFTFSDHFSLFSGMEPSTLSLSAFRMPMTFGVKFLKERCFSLSHLFNFSLIAAIFLNLTDLLFENLAISGVLLLYFNVNQYFIYF